jgi:hypothetical protein
MQESVKDQLVAAFRYLLKPIVRLALKNGVSYPEFSEALKAAYVDVAAKQLRASGREESEEGIAIVTNIVTPEVQQILRGDSAGEFRAAAQQPSPLATVLTGWHTDAQYTGPYGVLKDLPFSRSDDPEQKSNPTFTDLVQKYSPGFSARALIEEMTRAGAVKKVGTEVYRALQRAYVPPPLSPASILMFARVVHNACESAEINLRPESANEQGLFERTVNTVHGISKKDLRDFDAFIRAKGQLFVDDVDNWLADRDKQQDDGVKTGIGFYQYVVNEDDESALPEILRH